MKRKFEFLQTISETSIDDLKIMIDEIQGAGIEEKQLFIEWIIELKEKLDS